MVTLTGVQLKGRFGNLDFHKNLVKDFRNKNNLVKTSEKPKNENAWSMIFLFAIQKYLIYKK